MSDKYGYIGIETLLVFCSNQKDHCVTPNDFMRMNRIKIDERPHGEWVSKNEKYYCSNCKKRAIYFPSVYGPRALLTDFCPCCGADMREGDVE